jgi:phage terminase large subunit
MGLDEPENAEGPNVDYIWCDEYRLVGGSGPSAKGKQETAWRVINRRLRGSIPNRYPVGLWFTTTPDAPGSVTHGKFEDPKTRIKNSVVYRWSIYDNPYLRESYLREIEASHSGGLADRFIYGRFATVASGSFAFDYTVHVKGDEWFRREFKRVVYGVDFGWSNPSAIVAVGLDGDGRAYVLDEFYQNRVSDEALLEEAIELNSTYGKGYFRCDRSEPKTIQVLKKGVRAVADESKRDDGIREIGGRFKVQGDGKPRIYIHERCTNLIAELQVYDAERKEYDHAVDALRYALTTRKRSYGARFVNR